MKIFPEGRSRTLSAVALALGCVCGLMAFFSGSDLILMARLSSTTTFNLFMMRSLVPVDMPPLAALAADHPLFLFILTAAFWLSGCVLSLGVWRRREWARLGAVAMLYLIGAAALLMVLFPALVVPKPFVYEGVELAPEFNAAVFKAAFILRSVSACIVLVAFWWARLLEKKFKPEFPVAAAGGI